MYSMTEEEAKDFFEKELEEIRAIKNPTPAQILKLIDLEAIVKAGQNE
jgi:hypothetical protein